MGWRFTRKFRNWKEIASDLVALRLINRPEQDALGPTPLNSLLASEIKLYVSPALSYV